MLEKIKSHCYIDKATGCWIWKRAILSDWDMNNRRPSIRYEGKTVTVARLVWELFYNEEFPSNLYASHLCETYSPCAGFCVNPEHIAPMTARENEALKRHYYDSYYKNEYDKKRKQVPLAKKANIKASWTQTQKVNFILENLVVEVEGQLDSPCLESATSNASGYWRRSWGKGPERKNYTIHRLVAAEKILGIPYENIPKHIIIRHLCDNKRCVNPEHLCPGSPEENTRDSRDYHSNTDLTSDRVREMLETWKTFPGKETWGSVKKFWELYARDITYNSCAMILRGDRWSDIYDEVFNPQKPNLIKNNP